MFPVQGLAVYFEQGLSPSLTPPRTQPALPLFYFRFLSAFSYDALLSFSHTLFHYRHKILNAPKGTINNNTKNNKNKTAKTVLKHKERITRQT